MTPACSQATRANCSIQRPGSSSSSMIYDQFWTCGQWADGWLRSGGGSHDHRLPPGAAALRALRLPRFQGAPPPARHKGTYTYPASFSYSVPLIGTPRVGCGGAGPDGDGAAPANGAEGRQGARAICR
jgi:hypothetical protein